MPALHPDTGDRTAHPVISDHGMILHQVAGLTAGGSVPMNTGRYGLGLGLEASRALSIGSATQTQFVLEIATDGGIYVDPQRSMVRSGGQPLNGRSLIEGDDIDLGSARFLVQRGKHDEIGALDSPHLAMHAGIPVEGRSTTEILGAVTAARIEAARAERSRFTDLIEILASAGRADAVVGQQPKPRPFGEVAVAYGDQPWSPKLDKPEHLSAEVGAALANIVLPSIPLAVNLLGGSFGIVGERAMVLSAARAAVISLSVLTAVEQLSLVLLAKPELAADWRWANQLPHTVPGRSGTIPLTIVDGINVNTIDPTRSPTGPTMHLATNMQDLAGSCTSFLVIEADGSGQLISPEIDAGQPQRATPIGITEDLALTAATALRARTPNLATSHASPASRG